MGKIYSKLLVLISTIVYSFSAHAQVTLFEDNFDSSLNAGWSITNGGGGTGLTWERTSSGFDVYDRLSAGGCSSGNSYITGSTEFIIVKSESPGNASNEILMTPNIPSSSYTTLTLSFDQVIDITNLERGYVEVSTNGGGTWVPVGPAGISPSISTSKGSFLGVNPCPSTSGGPVSVDHQSIDISAYAGALLKIRFRYLNNNDNGRWWALDNIKVTGVVGASAPIPDFNSNTVTGCMDEDTIQFNDQSSGSPTSWEWRFNPSTVTFTGGTTKNSQNPKVIFSNGGAYDVELKATNAQGSDSLTKSDYVVIDTVPTVDAGPDVTRCSSDLDAFNISGTVTGSATGGWWTNEGGTSNGVFGGNTTLNTTFTPTSSAPPGPITIYLESQGGKCSTVKDSFMLTFTEAAKVDAGIDFSVCASTGGDLAGVFKNATSVEWSGGDGTYTPNNTTHDAHYMPSAQEKEDGEVKLYLSSVGGCAEMTDSVTITLMKTDSCLAIGVSENLDNKLGFEIYPNPTSEYFNVDLLNNSNGVISIYNSIGEEVRKINIRKQVTNINVKELTRGLYYVQYSRGNSLLTKKVIIK